jgi:hypothetical protein
MLILQRVEPLYDTPTARAVKRALDTERFTAWLAEQSPYSSFEAGVSQCPIGCYLREHVGVRNVAVYLGHAHWDEGDERTGRANEVKLPPAFQRFLRTYLKLPQHPTPIGIETVRRLWRGVSVSA